MKVRMKNKVKSKDDKTEQQSIDAIERERREDMLGGISGRSEAELKSSPAPEPIETD